MANHLCPCVQASDLCVPEDYPLIRLAVQVQAAHLQRSNSGTHLQRSNSGSGKLGIAASPRRERPFSQLRRMVRFCPLRQYSLSLLVLLLFSMAENFLRFEDKTAGVQVHPRLKRKQ